MPRVSLIKPDDPMHQARARYQEKFGKPIPLPVSRAASLNREATLAQIEDAIEAGIPLAGAIRPDPKMKT
jgi:hypothetical protein